MPQVHTFGTAAKTDPAPRIQRPVAAQQRIAVGGGTTKVDDNGWQQF
jgi:hypothetical protein